MLSLAASAVGVLAALTAVSAGPAIVSPRAATPISLVTPAQWSAFNASVGGRLYRGFPVARPCYTLSTANGVTTDAAQCTNVQNLYKNDSFIADNFGAYQNTNWGTCQATGDKCLLDYEAPQNPLVYAPPASCAQGSVSPYYVDIRKPSDVQAAFIFAKRYSLPIAIKNSGHDYKGRSSAPDSLGLWTHNIQYITRNQKFVPAGCKASTAADSVTFGAGQGFLSLYQFAEANNITILGGSSETVGASGGWITGGGHGALSNRLGLGVDRAVEMKAVLPDGRYVTASRCQNPDIFFALRGGGGSTFGLVMETTVLAAPRLVLQVVYIRFGSLDPDAASKFLSIIIDNMPKWGNESWGGYIEPAAVTKQASGLVLMTPSLNNDQAKASMKPLTDYASNLLGANAAINNEVTQVNSFFEAYNKYLVPNEEVVGIGLAAGSRLIPAANFATPDKRSQLLTAMNNVISTTPSGVLSSPTLVYGGAPVQILVTTPFNYKTDGTNAVTPAWYTALWHVVVFPTFNYGASPADIKTTFQKASAAAQYLRDITPGSGAYQNEADVYEPNYAQTFWGTNNYNKLLKLKGQLDPSNLLTCHQCVGWKNTDTRYKCYPEGP